MIEGRSPNPLEWLVLLLSPEGVAFNTIDSPLYICVSLRCETFVSFNMIFDNDFVFSFVSSAQTYIIVTTISSKRHRLFISLPKQE